MAEIHPHSPLATLSEPRRRSTRHAPAIGLVAVGEAARAFFQQEFQAREVRITKIVPATSGEPGWEVEADILVPDLAIRTLGLALTQEVLERASYAVQLDASMAVTGFEPIDG